MQPKRTVKLSDIARESGVSISTVSLVLRNKPGIPAETRQRVMNVARGLGYRPKRSNTRAAASSQLHNFGLVLKSDSDTSPQANPFYSHVLAGIEDACRRRNINLLYATLQVDAENRPVDIPRILVDETIDGMLLVGLFLDKGLNAVLEQIASPVVLVDAYALEGKFDAVLTDNVQGAEQAVDYLIEHGHRKIAMVGGHQNFFPSICERHQGYQRALQAHGIQEVYFADSQSLFGEEVLPVVTQLLQQHPDITALFGCNDDFALAAMRAAQALGRRIPEDLSVIGFDNIDVAKHVTPALTTMHVDKAAMGWLAVQLLVNRIENPESDPVTSLLRTRLVVRDSVRRIA